MCVEDLSNALGSAQIHTGLSTSMWRGRGPGAGRFVRCLGSLPLCVVLFVQADRNYTSDRCLGSAAERGRDGEGGELHTHPIPHPPTPSPSLLAIVLTTHAPAGAFAPAGRNLKAARPDFEAAGPGLEAARPDFEAVGPDFLDLEFGF